jgi:hypothetical protein
MWKNTVFELFRFYIEVEEKSLIYSFVEQVKLYRLVYKSISKVQNFQEKKCQKLIRQFLTLFTGIFEGASGIFTLADQ